MISYEKQLKYIYILCLGVGFYFQMLHLTTPLLDQYGFRQTQTAITSYWFLKEGFQWAYQTPLFGVPWSVPLEFPLYQYIVYIFVKVFNIENLDLAGRIVSIAFYYALMYPLWQILKILEVNKIAILYIFILLVTSPIFIFWSRTFMIESAGLYFTLMFIMYVLKYDKEDSISLKILFFIFIFGTFAVLTKITTLLVGFIFIFLYLLFYGRLKTLLSKKNIVGILIIGVVVAIGIIWNEFANSVKSSNPLSSFLVSSNLTKWNFGTMAQRLDFTNYQQLFVHMKNNLSSLLFLVLFIPGLLFCKVEYKKLIVIGFLTFSLAFMTLFNLYKVHNYYWYANSLFVVISIGLLVYFFSEKLKYDFMKIILLFAIISISIYGYHSYYYKTQVDDFTKNRTILIGDIVNKFTKDNDILITMGLDWNSELPYYSKRKAIMIRNNIKPSSEKFKNLFSETMGVNAIGSVVICGVQPEENIILSMINPEEFGFIEIQGCKAYINNVSSNELKEYFISETTLSKEEKNFFEQKSTLQSLHINLTGVRVSNAIKNGNDFISQNNDMFFSFTIPDACQEKNKIGLEVSIYREYNGMVQVFYKTDNEHFTEVKSIRKNFPSGEVSMKFLIKNKDISNLRIDPTDKIETIKVNDLKVYCEDNNESK